MSQLAAILRGTVVRLTARVDMDDDAIDRLRAGLRQVMEHGRLDARPQGVDLCGT